MAKKQKDPATPPPPLTTPNDWDASHGTYIAGRAALDAVDAAAIRIENHWGCGRLRLLVGTELREKFDRQRYLLNAAVLHGDLVTLQRECSRMLSAYTALDTEAHCSGAEPLDPEVWEVTLSDGTVAAICKDNAAADRVVRGGRAMRVFMLEEIGRMIDGYPGVVQAKAQWPGAEVTAVRKSVTDPLDAIRHATSFDDPLDDLFLPGAG